METFKPGKSLFEKTEDAIYARVAHLPPEEQQKAITEILIKEYRIPKDKVDKLWEVEKKSNKKGAGWLYVIPIALATIGAGFFVKANSGSSVKEKAPLNTERRYEEPKRTPEKVVTIPPKVEKNKVEPANTRWNVEMYNTLPEYGKDIYKYYAEKNPTEGRGYTFLDKKSATQYIFDRNNVLVAKILAGFGKDAGDEKNTSFKYKEGTTTTPAGAYLISNVASPEDIKEYGPLQFSLFGITVRGDRVFLGIHQTYTGHGQLVPRTEKMRTPTALDNNFSDGCINIDKKDFEKYLKPYFIGDYKEILFVLPDQLSKETGVKFNVGELVSQITPMIREMEEKK